ncbi:hypothetical protein [Flavisphingopyxis soli]|nr:hypothetical protein [Sphingorhabdus soli]
MSQIDGNRTGEFHRPMPHYQVPLATGGSENVGFIVVIDEGH